MVGCSCRRSSGTHTLAESHPASICQRIPGASMDCGQISAMVRTTTVLLANNADNSQALTRSTAI